MAAPEQGLWVPEATLEVPRPAVYVGCGLTGAPTEFVDEVEALKDRLRDDYEVYDFVGLVNGTEADVYNWDIKRCVANCNLLVGVCDYPSIGLGWEMNENVNLGKPTVAVAHEKSKVTRLVLGAAAVEPTVEFHRYQNLVEDVPPLVAARFAAM